MTALLDVIGLTKAYPGVVANEDVSFSIQEGEVHALLGENGAGKSTLVKMVYGLVRPDAGKMAFSGSSHAPGNPQDARQAGIAMVFQHFSLFDALDVAENVALGMEDAPPKRILSRRIREVSERYGLPLKPDRLIRDLSAGERQRVEIVRCLLQDPKLLIMDEPTSVLTPQEVEILFETLAKLRSDGTSILYISHKLEEIRTICDEATILRLGKVVRTADPKSTSARDLATMMVGVELKVPTARESRLGAAALELENVSAKSPGAFGTSLKSISLTLHKGEILGIGGVAGNGQDELLGVLSGEIRGASGNIRMHGDQIGQLDPVARRALGLLAAPEERLGHAAAPNMNLTENAALSGWLRKEMVRNQLIDWRKARGFAEQVISEFDVRTPGTEVAARSLSGGNLQKFVVGREILQKPSVLVVNQPTWGVDASAASAIRQALLNLAAGGAAVLVISQDLDELMEISTSFAALNEGRLSDVRPAQGLDIDEIGLMMGGAQGKPEHV